MSSTKVKLNRAGVRQMLQSQEMLNLVTKEAQKRATSDQEIKPFVGFDRAKAILQPDKGGHHD